jgi:hypothetical protein
MGWQELLRDLEAQAEAADELRGIDEAADRTRRERAQATLGDRLRAGLGRTLTLDLVDGEVIGGTALECGPDWLLLGAGDAATEVIIPFSALRGVRGAGGWIDAPPLGPSAARLDLRWLLGRLARDRGHLRLHLVGGGAVDGTIDRVGADHVDLAVHDADVPRRRSEILEHRVVPLAALVRIERARGALVA